MLTLFVREQHHLTKPLFPSTCRLHTLVKAILTLVLALSLPRPAHTEPVQQHRQRQLNPALPALTVKTPTPLPKPALWDYGTLSPSEKHILWYNIIHASSVTLSAVHLGIWNSAAVNILFQ